MIRFVTSNCAAAMISDRLYFSDRQYSAYSQWIYHAWQRDGDLPADLGFLSKIAICQPSIASKTLEVVLDRGLGAIDSDRLRLRHVENDLERVQRISKTRSKSAKRGVLRRLSAGLAKDEKDG